MGMSDQLIDAINTGNLFLGAIAFGLLFARTSIRRREYPREVLLLLVALEAVVACLLLVSLELILVPNEAAPMAHLIFLSVTLTAVKIGLLWVLWITRSTLYRTGSRHVGAGRNADELDVDHDVARHAEEGR